MNTVTTYYLEMLAPASLQQKVDANGLIVKEILNRDYQLNKSLYQLVGKEWLWTDKLCWSDAQWQNYVASDNLRTWVAYLDAELAGYFELLRQENGNVEIIYFGLCHDFIGKKLGGFLLSAAISSAWNWQGTKRVWVHTCTLDHPAALQNYLARGMTLYKEETTLQEPPQ
jgi:GNAT superfamily N-acetyltransferase